MAKLVGMSVEENVSIRLEHLEKRADRRMLKLIRESGLDIRDLARLNAPVDQGNLEDAIEIEEERGAGNRINVLVGVDQERLEELAGHDYPYDVVMHESEYNLGERSKEKNRGVKSEHPDARVGNKYLERALETETPRIRHQAQQIMKDIINES